ncbi:MAG: histidine phosphatase family protein [Burkholderiales bacterium]
MNTATPWNRFGRWAPAWRAIALLALLPTIAVAQVPPPADRSSAPVQVLSDGDIARAMRQGGLVLYFRHAATDFSQNDQNSRGYEDCANQRNLIDRGRDDARNIGAAIKALGIKVDRVLASPVCRTMETARLIFGRAEPTMDVRGGPGAVSPPERYAPLRRLFDAGAPPGAVLALVSHGNPFYAVAGPPYPAEGEGVLIRSLGWDFEVVARIKVDEWGKLVAAGTK